MLLMTILLVGLPRQRHNPALIVRPWAVWSGVLTRAEIASFKQGWAC